MPSRSVVRPGIVDNETFTLSEVTLVTTAPPTLSVHGYTRTIDYLSVARLSGGASGGDMSDSRTRMLRPVPDTEPRMVFRTIHGYRRAFRIAGEVPRCS